MTKNKPGKFDCYAKAEPDEPMFILLGRDPAAATTIRHWIIKRLSLKLNQFNDDEQLDEASVIARETEAWRARKRRKGKK